MVNEKIEGFYDVCRQINYTGSQGVCIPHSNVSGLVLRKDVRDAVQEGTFKIYPVRTLDEGLELLTGKEAGSTGKESTLHWLIDNKLKEYASALKDYAAASDR